jgi:hypothetical protein
MIDANCLWAGLTVESWVVDLLHTWALGPLAALIAFVLTFCLQAKLFHPCSPHINSEDAERLALVQIRALMMRHYKDHPEIGTQAFFNIMH